MPKKELGFRAAAVIQFCSRYLNVFVQLILTMILARLLTPDEYGVMAVVAVLVGFFSIISNVGINAAVIQYRDLSDYDCGALFTFTILVGFVLAAVFCALSAPVSWFYQDEQYLSLLCFTSLSVLFHAANMVPNGVLIRDKQFLIIGFRAVTVTVLCGVVCVALAFLGFGVYSLAVNSVLNALLILLWNIVASKIPVGVLRFKEQLKLVWKFSLFQFVAQVTQYLIRNLDTLLIGVVLGSTPLGFYDKAYKLAKYPIDIVPSTITPVLKSFFSAMQDDVEKLYDSFLRVQKVLSILGVYFSVVCFFSATELILLFFGDQWGQSIAPFSILSLSIYFQMINFTVFSALEALKRTDFLMRQTLISGGIMVSSLIVGLLCGTLESVAIAECVGFVLYTIPVVYYVIHKAFNRSVVAYLRNFIPEIIAGLVTCVLLMFLCALGLENMLASLAAKVLLGIACYVALLKIMGQTKYLSILKKN